MKEINFHDISDKHDFGFKNLKGVASIYGDVSLKAGSEMAWF